MLKTGDIVLLKKDQNRLGIVTVASEDHLVIYPTCPTQFSMILRRAAKIKGYNIKCTIEELLFVDPIELAVESSIYEPDYDNIIRLDNMTLKDLIFPAGVALYKSSASFEVEKHDKNIISFTAPWTDQKLSITIEKVLKIFPEDPTVIAIKDIVDEIFVPSDGIKNNKMIKSAATFNGDNKVAAKKSTSRVLRGAALKAVIKKT